MFILERKAESVMEGMGDPGAFAAFQHGLEVTRTPAQMVSLLVGWNAGLLPLMRQILETNGALMIKGGRMHGHFRFGMNGLVSRRQAGPWVDGPDEVEDREARSLR